MSEKLSNGSYRNIFNVKRLYEHGFISANVSDGDYPFTIQETSWFPVEEIPIHENLTNIKHEEYPNFTLQILKGILRIKDGRIDIKHLDSQIPDAFCEWNSHIFLERIYFDVDAKCHLIMGS
jgi:hypothetical protein